MKYNHDGYNWLIRLEKGELLINSLTQVVRQENIDGAWLSGIGGCSWAELRFYDLPAKQYHWKRFDQPLEILSIQGSIAWDGNDPALHIHGTFSDQEMHTLGGHVKELEVSAVCEVLLHRWYGERLNRRQSDEVGLKLLEL